MTKAVLTIASASCALIGSIAVAQTRLKPDVFRWMVSVTDAIPLEAREYRTFDLESLTLDFVFSNPSGRSVVLQAEDFIAAARIAVTAETSRDVLPVSSEWAQSIHRGGDPYLTPVLPGGRVLLASEESFGWKAILRRTDGEAFDSGTYKVDIVLKDALATLRDGIDKMGLKTLDRTDLRVTLKPPVDARERAAMYALMGQKAMRETSLTAAERLFLQVWAEQPNEKPPVSLAYVYCRQGRYTEAISIFEQHMTGNLYHSPVPMALAQAYVDAGNDAGAMSVLRRIRYPDERVAARLAEMKAVTGRRPQ